MYDAIADRAPQRYVKERQPKSTFRPIHYLGSKLRFLPEISQRIDEVDPGMGPLCDLFSGSGTVSAAMARSRIVHAVDIQEYSRVICSAVLTGHQANGRLQDVSGSVAKSAFRSRLRAAFLPLLKLEETATMRATKGDLSLLRAVLEDASVVAAEGGHWASNKQVRNAVSEVIHNLEEADLLGAASVCSRHYAGAYFSFAQAIDLDALAHHAHSHTSSDLMLAATLSAASEVVNTVGKQFAQPLRLTAKDGSLKTHLVGKIFKDRSLSVIDAFAVRLAIFAGSAPLYPSDNSAIRGDYADALQELKGNVSVIYADPPYTRDHYSRFYHVLETIARGDDPDIDVSNIGSGLSRGFYRADRHQSDFCIKSKAPLAFKKLFGCAADTGAPLLLSYSGFDTDKEGRPRLLSMSDLVAIASNAYSNVDVKMLTGASHSKLTSTALMKGADTTSEILLLCKN